MPNPKARSKTRSRKKSTTQPKPYKPSPAILNVVDSLQRFVENHNRWAAENESALLSELEEMLTKLGKLQKAEEECLIPNRTAESFANFTTWLASNGVCLDDSPFRIDFTPGSETNDVTLLATRAIKKDELLMSVPSSTILTATSSPIKAMEAVMPALATMPSLSLALYLMYEAANPKSRFRPYIEILPSTFTTPFANFTPQHFLSLRPSHACDAAVNSLRAQVRNYTYIYRILSSQKAPVLSLRVLTFRNFVWALSVVMTRQNALPSTDPPTLALVPLWDLCNHEPGHFTTQVQVHTSVTVECRAMRTFDVGEPITIFYGARPNVKLLLFSGFVQPDNAYDTLPVSLKISREELLAPLKARALAKMGIDVEMDTVETGSEEQESNNGWVCNVVIGRGIVAEALAVARVVSMDKAALTDWLKRGAHLPERAAVDADAEVNARRMVAAVVRGKLELYTFLEHVGDGQENKCKDMTLEVRQLLLSEKKLLETDLEILENPDYEHEDAVEVEDVNRCHCCA
ncbi:histone-lysine N-methyltransferase setd3 [Gracilaria domingensis]|nr:histone-lysine N-methyltransferase setd3 [Gracilaria domingensis]